MIVKQYVIIVIIIYDHAPCLNQISLSQLLMQRLAAVVARSLVPVTAATLMAGDGDVGKDTVKLKKEFYETMLACGTPEAA